MRGQGLGREEIVALAIRILGPDVLSSPEGSMRLSACALDIRAQLHPRSRVMRTLGAVPIRATIEKISYEESSDRLVVTYRPTTLPESQSSLEVVRTDRVSGPDGDSVFELWRGLEGQEVIIYRAHEPSGSPRGDALRIAPYVESREGII